MTASTNHHVSDPFTHSFAMQYISLILFILIFSIGAFLPKDKIKFQEQAHVPQSFPKVNAEVPAENRRVELAHFAITDIFQRSGSEINSDALSPYESILHSHDITIEVEIAWGKSVGLNTALTRGENTRLFLESNGIPQEAISISVRHSTESGDGTISLFREAKG